MYAIMERLAIQAEELEKLQNEKSLRQLPSDRIIPYERVKACL